jgi:hypothetical protein
MFKVLNTKLIIFFFVALWLFAKAGEILGYLKNTSLAEEIRHSNGNISALNHEGLTAVSITDLVLSSGFASVLGLLVGLIIALIISRRSKWHWFNAVLALLIVYLSGWLKLESSDYVERLLRLHGERLNGVWYYLTNGLVCLLLGLLTFFLVGFLNVTNHDRLTVNKQSA